MAIDAGYGDSMAGKSKALEMLAGYIYEKSGKKTRVYIGDGGAETYNDRGLVDDGVIQIMDYSAREYPQTILKLMSDFWFLKDPLDQNSKLVAPKANLYEEVGLQIYEGGSVMGGWLLSDVPGGLAWHSAEATGFGGVKDEADELAYTDQVDPKTMDGDTWKKYQEQGVNSSKHYWIAQRKVVNAIRATKKFPGLTFWTFHPTEGADKTAGGSTSQFGKIEGKKIIGPDVAGKSLASLISKEFGNLFHFDQATLTKKVLDDTTKKQITAVEKQFRVYTRRHLDPDQNVLIEYVAGTRISGLKDYYVSKENGDSLLQVYQAISELRVKNKEKKG